MSPVFDAFLRRDFLLAWGRHNETPELDRIADSPTTFSEDGEEIAQEAQVNVRYAHFVYQLVKLSRPVHVLEIGMANGISSAFIAKARRGYAGECETQSHVIVDPFQASEWKGAGRALLKRLNLETGVEILEDYSYSAVPLLEKQGYAFDFVFIDGNHCMDYTLADVLLADRVLKVGGILTIDDSTDFGVKLAVPYLDRYRTNLTRIRFDGCLSHWLRERFNRRRRVTVYQKNSVDRRGADGV
jgi:predicted O-methyltransferase YrrM